MLERLTPLALAGLMVMGACDTVTEPVEEGSPAPRFSAGPVVQSVNGSGNFVIQGTFLRFFTDAARRNADGSVDGQWQRISQGAPGGGAGSAHGVITCFTIVGNQAWLGGYATVGSRSTPPNNEVAWRVVDNGEGSGAAPDEITFQWVGAPPGFAADWCANTPLPGDPFGITSFPISAGNIQLNP